AAQALGQDLDLSRLLRWERVEDPVVDRRYPVRPRRVSESEVVRPSVDRQPLALQQVAVEMILALADREVDKVHRTLGCNDRVHVLVAVVVDLPSDLRPGRRDLKLRAVASLAAEEVQPWLRIEC